MGHPTFRGENAACSRVWPPRSGGGRLGGERLADKVGVLAEDKPLPANVPESAVLVGNNKRLGGADRQAEQFAAVCQPRKVDGEEHRLARLPQAEQGELAGAR